MLVYPTIQKRKEYQSVYYQQRKQKKVADANATMEVDLMEGMTLNLSDLTRETTISKISFHIMFLFTEFCIILLIHVLNCKTRWSTW